MGRTARNDLGSLCSGEAQHIHTCTVAAQCVMSRLYALMMGLLGLRGLPIRLGMSIPSQHTIPQQERNPDGFTGRPQRPKI